MRVPACALISVFLVACSEQSKPAASADAAPPALAVKEGMLPVPGGQVWYRVTGSGDKTPVILLHGGPGYSSFYLRILDSLGLGRKTVRYDQLGGGKSTGLTDTSLINIAHFVAELDSVRQALAAPRVYLVGHSWGTILAIEYTRAHINNVAGLVLASPALDIPEWERHAKELVKTLPDSMQQAIRTREASREYSAPDYQAALAEFYSRYVWRHPVEADLDSLTKTVNQLVYGYMQGPSEFTIVGTLKHYNSTSFLPSITVPTLFTVGEFDEANPETVRKQAMLVPGAQVAIIPGAAHLTTWDNPGVMLDVVRTFLRQADSLQAAEH